MALKHVVIFCFLLSLTLLARAQSGLGAKIQYVNKCPNTIDVVDSTKGDLATLATGASFTQSYNPGDSFNVAAHTTCTTGEKKNGLSLAEFTIDTVSFYDLDWYDISIIVGYDYPLSINAPAVCGADSSADVSCPNADCQPPQAYRKPDDDSATHSCNSKGGTYIVTFCPPDGSGNPTRPTLSCTPASGSGSVSSTSAAASSSTSSTSSTSSASTTGSSSGTVPASGYLKSKSTGKYVTLDGNSNLVATATSTASATKFTFTNNQYGYTIKATQFVCADNAGSSPLIANRPTADTWESFVFVQAGSYWEIKSYINNNYVSLQSNSQLQATQTTSGTIPDAAQFSFA